LPLQSPGELVFQVAGSRGWALPSDRLRSSESVCRSRPRRAHDRHMSRRCTKVLQWLRIAWQSLIRSDLHGSNVEGTPYFAIFGSSPRGTEAILHRATMMDPHGQSRSELRVGNQSINRCAQSYAIATGPQIFKNRKSVANRAKPHTRRGPICEQLSVRCRQFVYGRNRSVCQATVLLARLC
jgi:hypothetical protein